MKAVNRAKDMLNLKKDEIAAGKKDFFFIRSSSNYEKVFYK